jgi:DNA modification methylase
MAILGQHITKEYAIYNGDCMEVMVNLPDNSMHLSVYSPPFAGLYQYSSDERDLSNSRDYNEFMAHYQFVVNELHRITMPGRMTAVHCMEIGLSNTGRGDARMDFPGDIIELHVGCQDDNCTASRWNKRSGACGHGKWEFVARYQIWKEPLGVRNRTMMKALAHQTIVNDATKCSNAAADVLLLFRKKGENPIPVTHEQGLMNYAGSTPIPAEVLPYRNWQGKQIENRFSHWIWRQYASAFWPDIRLERVLPYKKARDEQDERHVHPLQLDVIDRAVVLFTNPGERVFTPFMGVGSEVYGAVSNERIGIGVELKPSYYRQAVKNVDDAIKHRYEETPLFHFAAQITDDEEE